MIHLDTSFLIRALVPGTEQDRELRRWLAEGESVAMSSVAWAEFLCGPVEPGAVEAVAGLLSDRVPFDAEDAVRTAELFNALGRRRGSLLDCMITAVALGSEAPLATANPSDFRPFEGQGLRVLP